MNVFKNTPHACWLPFLYILFSYLSADFSLLSFHFPLSRSHSLNCSHIFIHPPPTFLPCSKMSFVLNVWPQLSQTRKLTARTQRALICHLSCGFESRIFV